MLDKFSTYVYEVKFIKKCSLLKRFACEFIVLATCTIFLFGNGNALNLAA